MIQLRSRIDVADNTAKSAMMIRRIGQNKKTASVGDVIVCHIKETSAARCQKRFCRRAVVVRTRSPIRRRTQSRFDQNAIVLANNDAPPWHSHFRSRERELRQKY